ncbi:MAG: hypothetical protein VST68_07765 [Nitrospirota bacterium]|nr:hypothetical protein [Nitrospirota bacterium]
MQVRETPIERQEVQKGPLFHPPNPGGAKTPFSTGKASGALASGAYLKYVSTTKGRERRWRTLRKCSGQAF